MSSGPIQRAISVKRSRRRGSPFISRTRTSIAATLLLAVTGCRRETAVDSAAHRLEKVLLTDRFTAGRLARDASSEPCGVADTALVARQHCGEPLRSDTQRFATI